LVRPGSADEQSGKILSINQLLAAYPPHPLIPAVLPFKIFFTDHNHAHSCDERIYVDIFAATLRCLTKKITINKKYILHF